MKKDINKNKKEISLQDSKQLLLEMMIDIDRCCREHNIEYSMSYGTLLGAVRHHGFIPWDDDIDLMMTRDNFERFKQIYHSDRYEMLTDKDKEWGLHFIRICDTNTELVIDYLYESIKNHGLWIAIFPVDNMPDNDNDWNNMKRRILIYDGIRRLKISKWAPLSGFYKNISKMILRRVLLPIPINYIIKQIKKTLISYNNVSTKNVFEKGGVFHVYPSVWFENYIDLSFEGYFFRSIVNYDDYLTQEYGDYMTPPPESERVPKHDYVAYWK